VYLTPRNLFMSRIYQNPLLKLPSRSDQQFSCWLYTNSASSKFSQRLSLSMIYLGDSKLKVSLDPDDMPFPRRRESLVILFQQMYPPSLGLFTSNRLNQSLSQLAVDYDRATYLSLSESYRNVSLLSAVPLLLSFFLTGGLRWAAEHLLVVAAR
jgi:hypothetical protein